MIRIMDGITVVIRIFDGLAGIANTVMVTVYLTRIGHRRTVIVTRRSRVNAITIRIGQIFTGIAYAILITVSLIRVSNRGAVIRMIRVIGFKAIPIGIIELILITGITYTVVI